MSAEILAKLTASASSDEVKAAVAGIVDGAGEVSTLNSSGIVEALNKALNDSKKPIAREGGALLFAGLLEKFKGAALPFVVDDLEDVVKLSGDKKSPGARSAAAVATAAFAKNINAHAVPLVFDMILDNALNSTKWQTKVAAMAAIEGMVETAPDQISDNMVKIVPAISGLMWDSKKDVKVKAAKCLEVCCQALDNQDIQPFVPSLIEAIKDPTQVTECVHALAATTFVQAVDSSALSITVPVLQRGFAEKSTATKRKAAVITENLAKLVEDPKEVAPFMPVLEPALNRVKDEVADPEARSRCAAAHSALLAINDQRGAPAIKEQTNDQIGTTLKEVASKAGVNLDDKSAEFIGKVLDQLIRDTGSDEDDWKDEISHILNKVDEAKAHEIALELKSALVVVEEEVDVVEETDDELLCDCKFSLAYGSKILLNNARLYIHRGRRYGIVAAKSAGKTTLLRAISNNQVEGFPTADQLKTVFVEHDIQGSQAKMNVVEFTLDSVREEGVEREQVVSMLTEIGFTQEMQDMPITSLSGGWKMKLALARAMLRKADILLLDEPTNHLDVLNVQWVVDYLTGDTCSNVTSIIVSHDSKFLDNVATHIIHFDSLKLTNYPGNLSKFVEKFPHAKAFYDLGASTLKFSFPEPGPLDGVKQKGRAILQMENVSFTYPGAPKPQLQGVTIRVSMASRVACVGANGAGKSTMIKLLTGELKPSDGTVIKHPNCRFAYVAQHAFHHIEQHLDKTPNEYIQWRYQGGEDKESLVKTTVKLTDEEEKKMKTPFEVKFEDEEGNSKKEKRVLEKLMSRRKTGKVFEYEVKFVKKTQGDNVWITRDTLIDLGFKKICEDFDRRKAATEGAFKRTLTKRNIEEHLEAVGLDRELGTHNRMRDLSGGQKVKVVLGACTWAQPHIIILDEPTNYLDREALGALANAIKEFEGGVVLITHNKEFADYTTRETWVVANHRCDVKGDPEWEKYAQEMLEIQAQEEMLDASGNKVEVKKTPSSIPLKQKKKMIKELKKKIKNDDEMTEFEEDCATEWGLFSG